MAGALGGGGGGRLATEVATATTGATFSAKVSPADIGTAVGTKLFCDDEVISVSVEDVVVDDKNTRSSSSRSALDEKGEGRI